MVRLVPLPQEGELLSPGLSSRTEIVCNLEQPVYLGRNANTAIADRNVRTHVGTLLWDGSTLMLQELQATLFVNGTAIQANTYFPFLEHGDLIALAMGIEGTIYEYKVVFEDHELPNSSSSSASLFEDPRETPDLHPKSSAGVNNENTTSSSLVRGRKRGHDDITCSSKPEDPPTSAEQRTVAGPPAALQQCFQDELACAVCLELLVQATMLVPCGHVFCRSCVTDTTSCPTCRTGVESKPPVRTLDNIVQALVNAQQEQGQARNTRDGNKQSPWSVLEPEDIQHYQSRTQSITASAATTAKQPSPSRQNRRRRNRRHRHHAAAAFPPPPPLSGSLENGGIAAMGQSVENAIPIDDD